MRRAQMIVIKGWYAAATAGLFLVGTTAPAEAFEVWVANQAKNVIQVIDGATLSVVTEIPVGTTPHNVTFSPNFRLAYVSNLGSATVSVIERASRRVTATIPAGKGAHGVNLSPDGSLLYITNSGDGTVIPVEILALHHQGYGTVIPGTVTPHVRPAIRVGEVPAVAAFSPDGKKAYITNVKSGTLSVIDVTKGEVVKSIPDLPGAIVLVTVPARGKVYVTQGAANTVTVVDTRSDRVLRKVTVGRDAHSVSVTPDGKAVWVLNRLANSVSVIDTTTDRVTRTLTEVGDKPDIGDFSPDGTVAFITLRGQAVTGDPAVLSGKEAGLAVIDVASGARTRVIPLGGDPHGVAVAP